MVVLRVLEYACEAQPSPTLPFPIKPSDVFTWQPPSNYSDVDKITNRRDKGLSSEARAAIAITVPVIAFLLISIILLLCYVRKHDPYAQKKRLQDSENYALSKSSSHKHNSKSTPGWSHTSTTPSQKIGHSRNRSDNSYRIYPAPLNPQKVQMPAPLRTQNTKSPIPFSRLNTQRDALRARNSPIPFSNTYNEAYAGLPSDKADEETYLPATTYSPPPPVPPTHPEPSLILRSRQLPRSRAGLVSWERIAIQNARIRATQGTSPSPVSPLTQVRVVPMPRSPDFRRKGSPFQTVTSGQAEAPRRRGTPGAGEALHQGLPSPLSPLRSDTPFPDNVRVTRSGSGGGGMMRNGSGRSERARKEVRWSKEVDYEG